MTPEEIRLLLYNIAELADGMDNSLVEAARLHLHMISRYVKHAQAKLDVPSIPKEDAVE
jgi:hypothetical protein